MATALDPIEGKYEILEQLQVGGMGAIYKVRHRLLGDLRVVKVLRPQLMDEPSLRERFLREAQAAIRLSHPHIAQIYDFTVDEEGRAYMVMEYIEGWTLAELVDRGELPPVGLALEIACQGLSALGHLHRKGLIHRDVSPDNLMLFRDVEGGASVKLIDLGLIKAVEGTGGLTASGMFLGKFQYASPEHFSQGSAPVGPWSDLYSFGLVLYELLTGRYPIVGHGPSSLIAGHLFRTPLSFGDTDPTGRIPVELREVVERSLAKSKDERFPSAEAFGEALRPLCERFPAAAAEAERILDLVSRPRARTLLDDETHDTTQSRFDHQFVVETTRAEAAGVAPTEVAATVVARTEDGALAGVLARLERHLVEGRLRAARAELDAAREEHGDAPELVELAERLQVTEEISRRSQVGELLGIAREASSRKEYDSAIEALEQALQLSGDDPEIHRLLAEARRASRRRERHVALAEACSRIDALLLQESLAEAAAALDEAERAWGPVEKLQALRARLDGQLRRRDRERRVEDALDRIDALRDGGRLEEAHQEALRLRGEAPLNKLVELQVLEIEQELEERREKARREAAKRAAEAEMRDLVERGDLEEASRRLPGTLDVAGPTVVIQSLKAQVEKHGAKPRTGGERRRRADELVAKARRLAQAEDFEPASELLGQALGLVEGHPEALALRASVEICLEIRHEESRSEAEVTGTIAGIRDLLNRGKSGEALRKLDEATQRFGERPELSDLRYEAVQGRIEGDLEHSTVALAAHEVDLPGEPARHVSSETRAVETVKAATDSGNVLETVAIQTVDSTALEPTLILPTEPPLAKTEVLPAVTKALPTEDAEASASGPVEPPPPEPPPQQLPQRGFDEKTLQVIHQVRAPQAETVALGGLALGGEADEEGLEDWEELPGERSSTSGLFIVAVVVIVLLSLGVGFWLSRQGVLRTGTGEEEVVTEEVAPAAAGPGWVALDAAPWAELVRVVDEDGVEQALPEVRTTPLVLTLRPGTYRLSLSYPPRKKTADVEVTVAAGERHAERTKLQAVSARSLLRPVGPNPSPALRQVAEAYVAGDYETVLQRAGDDLGFPNARERSYALLLRAAARWSLYVLGGEKERWMLEGVAEEIRIGRSLGADLRIDEALFPPRFAALYNAGR